MSDWSNWLEWGATRPQVQSLNNLGTGVMFPMFSPTGSPNYPMFGPNAAVPNSLPGAGLLPQMTWAEQVAATGYPAPRPSTLPRVPMFDAAGVPSSIPRPMFDAAGNPLPIYQTYTPGPGVPANPAPSGVTQFKTPLVPNQPSMMPNARPMTLTNPTRIPMFDAAGNPNPIPGGGAYTPGPGVPARPVMTGSTSFKYPMFDTAGNLNPPPPRPDYIRTPPPSMPNARPMFPTNVPPPVNVPPPTSPPAAGTSPPATGNWGVPGAKYTAPGTRFPSTSPSVAPTGASGTPSSPPPPSSGAGNPYQRRLAAQRAAAGASGTPSGTGAAGGPSAAGGGSGAGAGTPPPAAGAAGNAAGGSSGGPRPYSAFRGANPFNVRGALSSTGSIGARLPGFMTTPIPPIANTAVGTRLPGFMTNQLSGWRGAAAGLGTGVALNAMPGMLTSALGADPNSYGARSAQGIGRSASLGLFGGVPIAAATALGVGLGDAVAAPGGPGRDLINAFRENVLGWGPTDDTALEAISNVPGLGWLDGGGGEQTTPATPAPLPPTVESLAQVASLAQLDPDSTQMIQQQFQSELAVAMAQYTANPAGFAEAWKAGNPEFKGDVTPDLIAQAVFQSTIEQLPSIAAGQSARQQMLDRAAAYQEALAPYLAPLQSNAQQTADLLAQAGPGFSSYAAYAAQQPAIIEQQLRLAPYVAAQTEYQNQMDQLAQQQFATMMSGGGGQSFDALTAAADAQLLAQ